MVGRGYTMVAHNHNDKWILNPIEQKLVKHMAEQRQFMNRIQGAVNKKKNTSMTPMQTEIEGIAAEFAYCRILNLYPDIQVDTRRLEDATLPDGRLVDVKTTRPHKTFTPRLMVEASKKKGVDIYALMVGKFPEYRYAGYADANVVREKPVIEVIPGFFAHVLEEYDLWKTVYNISYHQKRAIWRPDDV
jgi:hypothetical protein